MSAPQVGRSARSSASANAATRAFSVTTWRAIGSSATCSIVASRSVSTPRRAAAASHAARRSRVRARLEPALEAAVDHEDLDGRRERNRRDRERAAVEQERVTRPAAHRRELVHHAARHAAGELLGFLARRARASVGSSVEARDRAATSASGDLERRARRQPRSDRHGRRDLGVEADRAPGRGGRAPRARRRRCDPTRGSTSAIAAEPSAAMLDDARERRRSARRARPSVRAPEADAHLAVDRDRQAEARLVVGVIADQVDPSGRPHEPVDGTERSVRKRALRASGRAPVAAVPLAAKSDPRRTRGWTAAELDRPGQGVVGCAARRPQAHGAAAALGPGDARGRARVLRPGRADRRQRRATDRPSRSPGSSAPSATSRSPTSSCSSTPRSCSPPTSACAASR